MRNLLTTMIVLQLITGCISNKRSIEHVSVTYYNGIITTPTDNRCIVFVNKEVPEIISPISSDTSFTEKEFLDQLNAQLKYLQKVNNDTYGSASLRCLIHFDDSKDMVICIDWFGYILINEKNCFRNDTLCYLIRREIGFYEGLSFPDSTISKWFPEYVIKEVYP